MTRQLGLLAGLLLLTTSPLLSAQKYEGETCTTGTNLFGECKRIASCDSARVDIQNGKRPKICSYDREVPIVCCADPSILSAPETAGSAPLWPSEGVASQRPTQRPAQRPTQRPTQRPPPAPPTPAVPPAPPVTTASPTQPPKTRPQWWQIPIRKRTESPAVIDNLATTISVSGVGNNQLPPRLQRVTETQTQTEETERIVFHQNQRI